MFTFVYCVQWKGKKKNCDYEDLFYMGFVHVKMTGGLVKFHIQDHEHLLAVVFQCFQRDKKHIC